MRGGERGSQESLAGKDVLALTSADLERARGQPGPGLSVLQGQGASTFSSPGASF